MRNGLREIDNETLAYNLRRIMGNTLLPHSYAVIDLETTGFMGQGGRVWQLGVYAVLNGEPIYDNGVSIYLDLPEDELRTAEFEIGRRAAQIQGLDVAKYIPQQHASLISASTMAEAEQQFVDEVKSKGVPRGEGIAAFVDLIREFHDGGLMLVGQNFVSFDIPFIQWECKTAGLPFDFTSQNLLDTGMLIKAGVLGRRILEDEPVKQFYSRVSNERAKGVYFAIERFCIPYWDMEKTYGIDPDAAHDAGYDCYITSLVLRELIDDANSVRVTV